MKPDALNEGLYKQLGLLYEANYFASQLTNDPMGQLDPIAFAKDALPHLHALIATLQFNEEGMLNENDAFHLVFYPFL